MEPIIVSAAAAAAAADPNNRVRRHVEDNIRAPMNEPFNKVCARLEERGLLAPVSEITLAHHVTMFEVCSRQRTQAVSAARHAVWRHLRALGFSDPEIGKLWGVDRATVYQALMNNKKREKRKKAQRDYVRAAEVRVAPATRGRSTTSTTGSARGARSTTRERQ